jgi:signal transduction histidine kinase/CheY-like chemotaxis protein
MKIKKSVHQIESSLDTAYKSRISDLSQSISVTEQALSDSRQLGDKRLIAKSLSNLSLFYMISGEHHKSMVKSEEAISLFTELEDEKGIADVKYNIAGIHYKTDNFHSGLTYLIDCLPVYRKYNDHFNLARTEKSLGTIYEYIGDENSAITAYENSIAAATAAGDENLKSNVYNPLSGIYLKRGETQRALDIIQKSIAIKTKTGDIRGLAFALYGRGKVYTRLERYTEAENDFTEALKIHLENGEKLGTAMTYRKMGMLYDAMNDTEKAKNTFKEALNYSNKYNIAIIKIKSAYHLYRLYKKENDVAQSLAYLEEYVQQREKVINTQTLKVMESYELKSNMELMEQQARMEKERAEILEKKNIAEQSSKVRQEFLSTMSHEIRTPLNAVTTIVSLLKDRTDPEEQQLINSLRFSSANLLQIINDILDFTKLESGNSKLELRPFSLKKLVQNIGDTYRPMASEKGLQINMHIDDTLADGYEMDETKLMQILGNLVSNAVKYTEKGTVDITVSKKDSEGEFHTVRYCVKDTGVGITEQNLKRIFDEFFQPENITTRKEKGTGLGLAIVKKLVELHGSAITAESEPGVGSVFCFNLKLKPAKLMAQSAERKRDGLHDKLILLAEDNVVNAMVATKLLANWGATTEHVITGLDAVEKTMSKTYDIILMDLHMPGMNGYDATRNIRKEGNPNLHTRIYALTADITADQEDEYVGLFNGFLRKPIEIDTMYNTLVETGDL